MLPMLTMQPVVPRPIALIMIREEFNYLGVVEGGRAAAERCKARSCNVKQSCGSTKDRCYNLEVAELE